MPSIVFVIVYLPSGMELYKWAVYSIMIVTRLCDSDDLFSTVCTVCETIMLCVMHTPEVVFRVYLTLALVVLNDSFCGVSQINLHTPSTCVFSCITDFS